MYKLGLILPLTLLDTPCNLITAVYYLTAVTFNVELTQDGYSGAKAQNFFENNYILNFQ